MIRNSEKLLEGNNKKCHFKNMIWIIKRLDKNRRCYYLV